MDCEQFRKWLEERDLSDLSESDRASKHSNLCDDCRGLAAKDALLDETIARGLEKEPLPDHLEKIVALNLGSSRTKPKFSSGMIKIASAGAGVLALLLVFFLLPGDNEARKSFGTALAQDHIVIEQQHPVDEVANLPDWLATHADFRATLPASFGIYGFKFVGARICVIENCNTVHLVYRDGDQIVSLYIVDAKQVPASLREGKMYQSSPDGLTVKLWRENHQVYAVIT